MSAIDDLEKAAVAIIGTDKSPTKDSISDKVNMLAPVFTGLSQEDLEVIKKRIEARFSFTMGLGDVLQEAFTPWLSEAKTDIEWHYWDKYRDHLLEKGMGTQVASSLDNVTERILALAENPKKSGIWERKGMVVGHVQSGKTANYVGLISKAADAGYKVFIVIAGVTNSLRRQTQMRIEQGFTGRDTSNDPFTQTGVGLKDHNPAKQPITFTTVHKDFNKTAASQFGAHLESFASPIVFVIKKNTNTLQNLIDWLQQSIQSRDALAQIQSVPMMLIDDEADNASINTKQNPDEVTKINKLIRQLLGIFNQKCYIGYTATPFANIFIDDKPIDGIGGDLFPRDFIYCLDAPSNYHGAQKIFGKDADPDIVRTVGDHQNPETGEGILPLTHKKDLPVESLPDSLIEAVNAFFLVRAIRILRGDGGRHNSMLVNVSRFNDVQSRVQDRLIEYLTEAQNSIRYNYKMASALENETIARIKCLFDAEYAASGFSWGQILEKLHDATAPIKVYKINQSSQDALDYENHPNGLNIIAVGGLALSRGLTLEGLSVSYLIRNTMMYDTLMQMGRWFGYRDGYEDLCRIYMPEASRAWYEFVTEATDELIADFKYMASLSLTPQKFGLRVKKSPFNLLVTAKNKMWSGTSVREKVDLSGRYVETKRILTTTEGLSANQSLFYALIDNLQKHKLIISPNTAQGYLWKDVSADLVLDFVKDYKNHDGSVDTQMPFMHRFVRHIKEKDGIDLWDIALVSVSKAEKENQIFSLPIENSISIIQPYRKKGKTTSDNKGVEVTSRRRMASQGVEKTGLTDEQIAQAEVDLKDGKTKNIDKAYRSRRSKPLLVLFLANLENDDGTLAYPHAAIYGISFPHINRDYDYEGEEYIANKQWILENYGALEDDDEAEDAGE